MFDRRHVRIGAKSALDPHAPLTTHVAEEATGVDLAVPELTTIKASRTFWDKAVIAHGLPLVERRSELRSEGERVSRHYYDLHCLMQSETGRAALADLGSRRRLGASRAHAFPSTDYDLASAVPGNFAIGRMPQMVESLVHDYANTTAMIFGTPPASMTLWHRRKR
ncbi:MULTISPECIES: nucleotidyl transferase AbiEii/AbiGii toxin family protein [unclassified Mesorhizobium]|uniref:nucleotidyl transferase AbiEii/AbiGii toxin family protein n=1 Tax=unclassified Mesorhizobium TaxID=325217 RepID=UPI00167AB6C4|nr:MULTISPECIES: nucleotidyl transferase AbiEii/AbiGii toxin family protein [unclassified Mesorhizobium]